MKAAVPDVTAIYLCRSHRSCMLDDGVHRRGRFPVVVLQHYRWGAGGSEEMQPLARPKEGHSQHPFKFDLSFDLLN